MKTRQSTIADKESNSIILIALLFQEPDFKIFEKRPNNEDYLFYMISILKPPKTINFLSIREFDYIKNWLNILIFDTTEEIERLKIHRISLSGGEPFIRQDFFEILSLCKKHSFSLIINSNGMLINETIATELKKYRFDRICITIDGSRAEIHDKERGKGSFKKAIEGIKQLQKVNLPVSTLFTLNISNVDNLIDTIKLNELLGIEHMSIMVVCPTGRAANGESILTPLKWYSTFLKLSEMKDKGQIKLNLKLVPPNESSVFWFFYFPLKFYERLDLLKVWGQDINDFNEERSISCKAGITSCAIAYNGDVYGCDLMTGIEEFKAGNIKDDSLANIWNNSKTFEKLRAINFNDLEGVCKGCEHKWCGGGCRSAAYNLAGSITGSDVSCFYKKDTDLSMGE